MLDWLRVGKCRYCFIEKTKNVIYALIPSSSVPFTYYVLLFRWGGGACVSKYFYRNVIIICLCGRVVKTVCIPDATRQAVNQRTIKRNPIKMQSQRGATGEKPWCYDDAWKYRCVKLHYEKIKTPQWMLLQSRKWRRNIKRIRV